jgi:hypothetical protein
MEKADQPLVFGKHLAMQQSKRRYDVKRRIVDPICGTAY